MIDVVVVEPGRDPIHRRIRNELEAFQQIIGGHIEVFSVGDVDLIFNEEGKILDMPESGLWLEHDPLMGPVLFTASEGGEFISLSEDAITHLLRTVKPPMQIKL